VTVKPWIFFDFDNTLMATEQHSLPSLITRFNELYGAQISTPLTVDLFHEKFSGMVRETLCEKLSQHFGIVVDTQQLYLHREIQMMKYLKSIPNGIDVAPNIMQTLSYLKEKDFGMAVVSNNSVQRILTSIRCASNKRGEEMAGFFGTKFFEAGETPKPLPDVYQRAMEQVGADPAHSFAVEDSVTGATAAIRAGITTFGYTGLVHEPDVVATKLKDAGCRAVFQDWAGFTAILEEDKKLGG
jgi:HAD superfamily hydrolase (TIGR01509 family)